MMVRRSARTGASAMADGLFTLGYPSSATRAISGSYTDRKRSARAADDLIGVLHHHPSGVGEKALRADIAGAGLRWGVDRLEAAKRVVEKGHGGVRLVDRGPGRKGAPKLWCLVPDTADTTHPAGAAP